MISAYRIKLDSCNSCHSNDRVVEFKIGKFQAAGGLLVRFCHACCDELRARLAEIARLEKESPR